MTNEPEHGVQDDAMKCAGYGERIGFGEHPALVAVDIIRAFTEASYRFVCDMDVQIDNNNRIIGAARAKAVPIIFTTVWYDDPDLKDAGIWGIKLKGAEDLRFGTPAVEVDPRLDQQGGDAVLMKKYVSSFCRLNAQRIDTDYYRCIDQWLRARNRGRRHPEWFPSDRRQRRRRRPLAAGPRAGAL